MITISGEGETLECGCKVTRYYPEIKFGSAKVELCKQHSKDPGARIPTEIPKLQCPNCGEKIC